MADPDDDVVRWLLAGDPAIRWQTLRDFAGAPERDWSAERAKVATEGEGAQLLAHRDPDGQWAGGAFVPHDFDWRRWEETGQPWTATCWALNQLREYGLDPASPIARETVRLVGEHSRWDHDGQPFWEGEVEECINGRTVADGAYFGVDVSRIVDRLVGEVQPDGGWNCERANGSTRSSFATTVNVLEGLWEFEHATGGTEASRAARRSGEEYLLARSLFRRASDGSVADPTFVQLTHPARWHHDVLRGLHHFWSVARVTGAAPDERLAPAVEVVRAARRPDGRWAPDRVLRGQAWFPSPSVDEPSPWITLRALRVLRWWDAHH